MGAFAPNVFFGKNEYIEIKSQSKTNRKLLLQKPIGVPVVIARCAVVIIAW